MRQDSRPKADQAPRYLSEMIYPAGRARRPGEGFHAGGLVRGGWGVEQLLGLCTDVEAGLPEKGTVRQRG